MSIGELAWIQIISVIDRWKYGITFELIGSSILKLNDLNNYHVRSLQFQYVVSAQLYNLCEKWKIYEGLFLNLKEK